MSVPYDQWVEEMERCLGYFAYPGDADAHIDGWCGFCHVMPHTESCPVEVALGLLGNHPDAPGVA